MADVKPFRAVRYAGAAGPLADLVAPPYDAVSDEERAALFTRNPYNVVHLTLPESAEAAGSCTATGWRRDPRAGRGAGVWLAREEFVGPDGVGRERHGVIVSLEAEPYETAASCRTSGPIRAFARSDGACCARRVLSPSRSCSSRTRGSRCPNPRVGADLEVDGTRLWRLPADAAEALAGSQLLIADGHHRYESAVELGAELGEAGSHHGARRRDGRRRSAAVSDAPRLR